MSSLDKTNFKKYLAEIFTSCQGRIILALAGLFFMLLYKVIIKIPGGATKVYHSVIRPLHNAMASICDRIPFSVAEVLIIVCALGVIIYTIAAIIGIFRKKNIIKTIICMLITYIMCFNLVYGGFCVLWGFYYEADDIGVQEFFGISTNGITHEELIVVDEFFVSIANIYADRVDRDADGHFIMDEDKVFEHSLALYDNLAAEYPGISQKPHMPKRFKFSKILSYLDFTGFFFPFSAEANINMDSPQNDIPSTIAHELAHQRGIAKEDEANFVAVLACMADGDPDYVYSACLMAVVHLQNALYKSGDKDNWKAIYDTYSEGVLKDISQNSEYWQKYKKSVSYKASNKTYNAFLKSYNQEKGLETYGACVDLIVTYYMQILSDYLY